LPNIQSAKKRVRQAEKRRARNRPVRSMVRTLIGKAQRQITGHDETAEGAVREALAALDRAARKGILHPNNAARRKSRLMKKFNQASAATA
jgi:small subunit ribosomal protein S20